MLKKYPFYFKSTVVLFGLILLVYALGILKDIFVPLVFALLLALLLNPLQNWFQRKRIPHIWAIILCLLIAFAVIIAIIYFLSSQIMNFGDQLPLLKHKFSVVFLQFQHWLYDHVGLNFQKQEQLISEVKSEMKPFVGETLDTALGTLGIVVLLPIYTALFLYYKTLILDFLFEVFSEKNSKDAYYFYRKFLFQGELIHFSGTQTDKNFRLFKKASCKYTPNRLVHETLEVQGNVGVLKNKLLHYSYCNYDDYKNKMIKYGILKSQELFLRNKNSTLFHRYVKPLYKFLYSFFIRLGLLDGYKGMIICYLHALSVYVTYDDLSKKSR